MQSSNLLQQNMRLKQIMSKCEQQIIQLKRIGQDHQNEIDSLLKFNQRLLSIIQNQMPGKIVSRKSSGGRGELLQPIEELNEGLGLGQSYVVRPGPYQTQSQGGINAKNPLLENDYMKQFDKMINSSQSDHYGTMPEDQIQGNIKNINGNILTQLNQQQNQRSYGSVHGNNNSDSNNSSLTGFNNSKSIDINSSIRKNIPQPPSLSPSKNRYNTKNEGQGLFGCQNDVQSQNLKQLNQNSNYKGNNSNGLQNKLQNNNMNFNNQNVQQMHTEIIFREQKQSLIQIPHQLKNFKLQKGLNEQYTKQLFESIQQSNVMGTSIGRTQKTTNQFGNNTKKGLNLKSLVDEIPTISQAVTQRLFQPTNGEQRQISSQALKKQINQVNRLLYDYKQDYNPEEYLQICMIIKNDLQKDLGELKMVNKQNSINIKEIQKQYFGKRQNIKQKEVKGIKKLKQIMNSLGIDPSVKRLIDQKIVNKAKK